jgi:hypothetical protein
MSDTDVKQLIGQIETLKKMFGNGEARLDPFSDADATDGILYLSRYSTANILPSKKKDDNIDKNKETDTKHAKEVVDIEKVQGQSASSTATSKEKKRQYALSLASLASNPARRAKIVNDGAISALIELSTVEDGPIKRSCAAALSYLSFEEDFRQQMVEEGCINAIISLSLSSSETVKSDCARAICNLCCAPGCEQKAAKDGAAYCLSNIASSYPHLIDVCLKGLLNMSCVSEKYIKIEEVNDAVLNINNHVMTVEQEILLLSALCNLSALRGNQLRLIEDGCMKTIDRIFSLPTAELRELSAEITCNLTSDARARAKLVDQNILKTLTVMSKDSSINVRTSCVNCFYNICRDILTREKIVLAGALPVIVKITMEKFLSPEMGRFAAKTIRQLCLDFNLNSLLVKEGVVKVLMTLVDTNDGRIRQ